jgi:hypothetical protein
MPTPKQQFDTAMNTFNTAQNLSLAQFHSGVNADSSRANVTSLRTVLTSGLSAASTQMQTTLDGIDWTQ